MTLPKPTPNLTCNMHEQISRRSPTWEGFFICDPALASVANLLPPDLEAGAMAARQWHRRFNRDTVIRTLINAQASIIDVHGAIDDNNYTQASALLSEHRTHIDDLKVQLDALSYLTMVRVSSTVHRDHDDDCTYGKCTCGADRSE